MHADVCHCGLLSAWTCLASSIYHYQSISSASVSHRMFGFTPAVWFSRTGLNFWSDPIFSCVYSYLFRHTCFVFTYRACSVLGVRHCGFTFSHSLNAFALMLHGLPTGTRWSCRLQRRMSLQKLWVHTEDAEEDWSDEGGELVRTTKAERRFKLNLLSIIKAQCEIAGWRTSQWGIRGTLFSVLLYVSPLMTFRQYSLTAWQTKRKEYRGSGLDVLINIWYHPGHIIVKECFRSPSIELLAMGLRCYP